MNNLLIKLYPLLADISALLAQIIPGIVTMLELFALTLLLSMPLGMILALGKISQSKIIVPIIGFYIWIMRGTPLLLQLIFFYFGAIHLGLNLSRFAAAVIIFALNYAAYFAEIFRAGIQAVDKSQREAAAILGFTPWQIMFHIICRKR